jgi:hypothetical protein
MNIASIILIATDPSFIDGSYILLSNNYVAILGVVFATIWTNKSSWNRVGDEKTPQDSYDPARAPKATLTTIQFDSRQVSLVTADMEQQTSHTR